ncbi:MAG: TolC family protein [Ferruginibacter sp.]|nr:TolC family protein [Ferruginibacter sp.]
MYLFRKMLLLQTLLAATLLCNAQKTPSFTVGSDSLNLSLDSTEAIFLRSNFLLLAQKYNIDIAKALVIQAKLYPNPNFSFSTTIYNPVTKKLFPLANDGEVISSFSQMILLAGKRNKQVLLAKANVQLTEFQFFDLIRTLQYTLRTDFFNIYYLQQSAKVYDEEIKALNQIVLAFEQQRGKGYIAEKEVIRIKALLYSFKSEYNDLTNQINDTESELRMLVQVKPSSYINPIIDNAAVNNLDPLKYQLATLLDTAYSRRTDLLIAKQNTSINRLNYNYQKALAVPDVTANVSYDQQGSYVKNLSMAGFSIDLPFFNRNQGNIKAAKHSIDAASASQKNVEASVEENVFRALQKAISQDKLLKGIDPLFSNDFERLMKEVVANYQKRNISILEFLDFYDSYKQNILQLNAIQFNRVSAFEDLNFYTANNFFN